MLSKIVYGKRGSNMYEQAVFFARQALCTGTGKKDCDCINCSANILSHSDLLILNSPSYLVEDIDRVVEFSHQPPLLSDRRVVLLNDLSKVSEGAQNKLLKELEENTNFILIATVVEGGAVLDTIKSRTESVKVQPYTKASFLNLCAEAGLDRATALVAYHMTQGGFGILDEMKEQLPVYQGLLKAILAHSETDMFRVLHISTEKDADCYYDKYGGYIATNLFPFMESIILSFIYDSDSFHADKCWNAASVSRVVSVIEKERADSSRLWYGKTHFFSSISRISAELKEVGLYE